MTCIPINENDVMKITGYICRDSVIAYEVKSAYCPTCGKETEFFIKHLGGYIPSSFSVCLFCGDSWAEDEMQERPFCRGWRKRAIEEARAKIEEYEKAGLHKGFPTIEMLFGEEGKEE